MKSSEEYSRKIRDKAVEMLKAELVYKRISKLRTSCIALFKSSSDIGKGGTIKNFQDMAVTLIQRSNEEPLGYYGEAAVIHSSGMRIC